MAGSILSYDKKIDDRLFSAHAFLIEGPSGEDNFLAAKELFCGIGSRI